MQHLLVFIFLFPATSFAQSGDDKVVHWRSIVGVITAQGVNNPVSPNISSGSCAWSTRSSHARVKLALSLSNVEGLVINDTSFSGTLGPVSSVTGALVCNAGTSSPETLTN